MTFQIKNKIVCLFKEEDFIKLKLNHTIEIKTFPKFPYQAQCLSLLESHTFTALQVIHRGPNSTYRQHVYVRIINIIFFSKLYQVSLHLLSLPFAIFCISPKSHQFVSFKRLCCLSPMINNANVWIIQTKISFLMICQCHTKIPV